VCEKRKGERRAGWGAYENYWTCSGAVQVRPHSPARSLLSPPGLNEKAPGTSIPGVIIGSVLFALAQVGTTGVVGLAILAVCTFRRVSFALLPTAVLLPRLYRRIRWLVDSKRRCSRRPLQLCDARYLALHSDLHVRVSASRPSDGHPRFYCRHPGEWGAACSRD
jgi:hypothetical protein